MDTNEEKKEYSLMAFFGFFEIEERDGKTLSERYRLDANDIEPCYFNVYKNIMKRKWDPAYSKVEAFQRTVCDLHSVALMQDLDTHVVADAYGPFTASDGLIGLIDIGPAKKGKNMLLPPQVFFGIRLHHVGFGMRESFAFSRLFYSFTDVSDKDALFGSVNCAREDILDYAYLSMRMPKGRSESNGDMGRFHIVDDLNASRTEVTKWT